MSEGLVPADGASARHLLALAMADPSPGHVERLLEQYAARADWRLYAHVRDADAVGCIGVALVEPGEAVVQHIAVALESRRRGVARSMIAEVTDRHRLDRLEAETDWASAYFFRACGFRVWSAGAADTEAGEVEQFRCVWTRGGG